MDDGRDRAAPRRPGGMELTPPPLRLAVLVSGRGSNLLAILDAIEAGQLTAQVVLVVANRPDAAALEHAAARGIDTAVVEGADTEGLVGRFKKEPGKPRPKQETNRIHSVVVPCYTQDGVAIRPAQVRVGVYA